MQQAWRELTDLAELVALAVDVDNTNVNRQSYGYRPVALVIKIVEDPITHGGTSVDLGLSNVGMYTLPDDNRHRLRELGTRGARLTFRPHTDAVAWLDQHLYDLPTLDQRREIIHTINDRWRNAA
ncbi:MAG: hypothetical protein GEU98_20640 [Pseudonocardiaceae bacterium]|nr:hypothetical protein [Pseudonocardiaceae bacterium]